jgi:hypothetical protein
MKFSFKFVFYLFEFSLNFRVEVTLAVLERKGQLARGEYRQQHCQTCLANKLLPRPMQRYAAIACAERVPLQRRTGRPQPFGVLEKSG